LRACPKIVDPNVLDVDAAAPDPKGEGAGKADVPNDDEGVKVVACGLKDPNDEVVPCPKVDLASGMKRLSPSSSTSVGWSSESSCSTKPCRIASAALRLLMMAGRFRRQRFSSTKVYEKVCFDGKRDSTHESD
jgi:hypothetical protein